MKHELQVGDHVSISTLPNSPMGVIGSIKQNSASHAHKNTLYVVFMDNPTDTINGTYYARAHELLNLTERVRRMHTIQANVPAYVC